jgi:hypothetical protein
LHSLYLSACSKCLLGIKQELIGFQKRFSFKVARQDAISRWFLGDSIGNL